MIRLDWTRWGYHQAGGRYDNEGDALYVGGIDEITAVVIIRVEELEAGLLVHCAEAEFVPFIANAHGPELEGGDVDTGIGREDSVTAEVGRGRSGGGEDSSHVGRVCERVLGLNTF